MINLNIMQLWRMSQMGQYIKPKRDADGKIVELGVHKGTTYQIGILYCDCGKAYEIMRDEKHKRHWLQ
jgi:hypothetical protein